MASTVDATVVAVFENANDARQAVNDLKTAGFGSDKVYVSSETTSNTSAAFEHREGGIKGWFKSLFGTAEDEHRQGYERAVASGKTVVSVDTPDANIDRVSEILNRYSPVDVHSDDFGSAHGVATSNVYNAGYQGSESDKLNAREELGLPVVEEELKVGKRVVQKGGVRVYSRITERPVEEEVRLREERVRVDRERVNRPANEADIRAGRDQVIEVPEYAEEPVIAKEARVVEQVRVSKDATERIERVNDTVRRSDVRVENLGAGDADIDTEYRRHFAVTYPAGDYEDYAPAYRYGADIANDERYRGREYNEIEPELRQDYGRRYPESAWERVKDAVRYGWDKVTGKTRSTAASR
ncbi:MAG TPA: DUF2382 domain-containing protein [Bryobacteraceae bacterium]|jgi:uncharacterized protein (TIGR02271 family)